MGKVFRHIEYPGFGAKKRGLRQLGGSIYQVVYIYAIYMIYTHNTHIYYLLQQLQQLHAVRTSFSLYRAAAVTPTRITISIAAIVPITVPIAIVI